MSENETPYAAARAAADAIEQLNHRTLNIPELTAPEIRSVVRALADLVDHLPQALDQLAHHLEKQQAAGQVQMEDGRDPAAPVDQALAGLRRAATLASPKDHINWGDTAGEFSAAVHDASGWLYNMSAPSQPEPDDEN